MGDELDGSPAAVVAAEAAHAAADITRVDTVHADGAQADTAHAGTGPLGALRDGNGDLSADVPPDLAAEIEVDIPGAWDTDRKVACTWCGAAGADVVPLLTGRRSRRRVVAAICGHCAEPEPRQGVGPLLLSAFAVVALASLWIWSVPGSPPSAATVAVAGSWVVLVVAYGVQALRAGWSAHQSAGRPLHSWRWAVPPLLGTAVAVAVLGGVPLRARFTLSRAAIASAAADAEAGSSSHGRLVAFPAGLLRRTGGSTGVLVDDRCGFFRLDGTGADPGGSAESAAGVVLTHDVRLGGGWRAGCLPTGPDADSPSG